METRVGHRFGRAVGMVVLLGVLTVAGGADAQSAAPSAEEIKRASDAFDQGKRAYRSEEWVEAAEQFEAADMAAPSAAALELALRSRERADQLDRAATLAALALDRHSDQPKLVKFAKDVLKKADKALHKLSVTCDEPCDLLIDNKLVHGRAAAQRTIYVAPGEYAVRAGWSGGRARSEQVTATKAGASDLSFSAPPEEKTPTPAVAPSAPKQPAPPVTDKPSAGEQSAGWSPIVFWVGTGLTVVAGAATAWSGIDTQNNPGPDRVREECAGQGESCDLYQEGLDKQLRTNILAGVTAGLGVATIIVGLFATDWGGTEKSAVRNTAPKPQAISPWIGIGSGATLGAEGRF